jgi:UDP-N-acetylglucosamine--N-acetylmuramyl-(pentapeptide) pyrophosphoryl-undecaprenol N-acetylglucosamine transferase
MTPPSAAGPTIARPADVPAAPVPARRSARGRRRAGDGALLVASSGGHLKQLYDLRPRLRGPDGRPHTEVTWLTFDTPQARSLLEGERVVFARYTAPRDVAGVLANLRLASRTLAGGRFSQVISTGSAIALSFLPLARALGVPCHYIESATRADGPSTTGRLMARVPGVHLYTQHAGWAEARWRYAGSVFDGFATIPDPAPPPAIRRAVVTLGTMETYGFRRLLERLLAVLPAEVEVLWQTGCTDTTGLPIDGRRAVGAAELLAAMRRADVVVAHAGTGTALTALEIGKCPVLVPRVHAHGEHVDDHQAQTARELAGRGLAVDAGADDLRLDHLLAAAARRVVRADDPPPMVLAGRPS